MSGKPPPNLSRRERQIMDIIYCEGRASVADVLERLPDSPSYSSVRALLRVLEEKGHVRHEQSGLAYVYLPTVSAGAARRSAVSHLMKTFFQGSAERAVAAVLEASSTKLSSNELERIAAMIEAARKEGR
jgi:BlaI family transcriptional regulator, penicillinase repressor